MKYYKMNSMHGTHGREHNAQKQGRSLGVGWGEGKRKGRSGRQSPTGWKMSGN